MKIEAFVYIHLRNSIDKQENFGQSPDHAGWDQVNNNKLGEIRRLILPSHLKQDLVVNLGIDNPDASRSF